MPTVNASKNFDSAMKKFKRIVDDNGDLQLLKDRRYFIKPSNRRNRAKRAAIARRKRES